jgi:multicomponent Na+:H+ antiporter subunit B
MDPERHGGSSIIVQTAARAIEPLLLVYAIYLLLAGHDEPGGGFVGGLVAAGALTLHTVAFGVRAARRALRLDPRTLAGAGLVVALAAVWAGVLAGAPPMTGLWFDLPPGSPMGALGTPVLFDAGVFLVVLGTALNGVFGLAEEEA